MKILFVCNSLAGGGAQKLLKDMIPCINNKGIICDLLILNRKNEKYFDALVNKGINVTVVPDKDSKSHYSKMKYIYKYIHERDYNIVHVHLFPSLYYCSVLKLIFKKKFPTLVLTEHSTDNRRRHIKILWFVERLIYSSFDAVVSISEQTEEMLLKWLKFRNKDYTKFYVVDNGIVLNDFYSALPKKKSDYVPQILNDSYVLGMVGSLTIQKNHEHMIKAMTRLPENYKLVIAGEGKLREELEKLTNSLNLEKRVFFVGFINDIPSFMKTVDAIVIPSIWEGFGLIAAEAMACERPIVASDIAGLREVVGNAGILINPNDSDSIAEAVLCLKDSKVVENLIVAAQKRVAMYDINRMVDEYIKVYKGTVK